MKDICNEKYLQAKDSGEIIPLFWVLEDSFSQISSATITIEVEIGIDTDPSTILLNAPIVQNKEVIQLIQNGIPGVTYKIILDMLFSDNELYTYVCYLPINIEN